ncbi:MAG: DUF1080 domain-containing protein [Bryobacteraceae bacterium]|nr:DUF1080 domain-containing protein [Bryobacteraceae bacterium]
MIALALVLIPLAAADFEPLFNGKNLDGWKMTGPGRFVVENGHLKTEGGMGLLYYERAKFGDCTLRVVFRSTKEADNSGVVIRMPEPPPDPWYGVHNGYEVQIDGRADDWHYTGSIYSISKANQRLQKAPGEWNTMDIVLAGSKTTVFVNGTKVNEYLEGSPVPARQKWYEPVRGPRANVGYIGLQNHNERDTIYFKEVSVKR